MADPGPDTWDEFWREIEHLRSSLRKSKHITINRNSLRDEARGVAQYYFRKTRPSLEALGILQDDLLEMDSSMQELLRLAAGRARKAKYYNLLRKLGRSRSTIELQKELMIGRGASQVAAARAGYSSLEAAILRSLGDLVPSAAASYEQALRDLATPDRVSWRGVAAELREVLREVLDRLAPKTEVTQWPGFKLEKGRDKPTMKQQALFILRPRSLPSGAGGRLLTQLNLLRPRSLHWHDRCTIVDRWQPMWQARVRKL